VYNVPIADSNAPDHQILAKNLIKGKLDNLLTHVYLEKMAVKLRVCVFTYCSLSYFELAIIDYLV